MALQFSLSSTDQKKVDPKALTILQTVYQAHYPAPMLVEVKCLSLAEMEALNSLYRQISKPTDVLSFPTFNSYAEIEKQRGGPSVLIGSIVLCAEKALEYNETLPQLVHHGLLHLLGFDHETDMKSWQQAEEEILADLAKSHLLIPPVPHESL